MPFSLATQSTRAAPRAPPRRVAARMPIAPRAHMVWALKCCSKSPAYAEVDLTPVIARKRFAIVGDAADGGADATLPGVSSPLELVVESSVAASHAPLDACAAAGLTITLIGGGSVAVNGAPLAVGERVPLAPGARLLVDGCEWEVWRNEAAHA